MMRDAPSSCVIAAADVAAGFPSPAEDFIDRRLDLNEKLIQNPAATFLVRVRGNSMIGAGILSGDVLIVDRSLEARDGQVVVARVEGDFTVKRLRSKGPRLFLVPENPEYKPLEIRPEMSFEIWGVVAFSVRSLLCRF